MTTMTETAARNFRSMATDVKFRVLDPVPDVEQRLDAAEGVFAQVAQSCTRFDPTSALMQANDAPDRWHDVPWELAACVVEAAEAYRATDGVFDPRVYGDLVRLGYDRSLPFATGGIAFTSVPEQPRGRHVADAAAGIESHDRARLGPWRPRWEQKGDRYRIHLDASPIDLGGIGKGLTVRWAAEMLIGAGSSVMVDAGGDCQFAGPGPSGEGWRVGMEDPRGGTDPLLVLSLVDTGCATSSVRVRRWQVNGRQVHHLIDPRTGHSGGAGLLSVTVVHPDVAWAEIWSKTLFLSGPDHVAPLATAESLAAAWVDDAGHVGTSPLFDPYVIWTATHV